MFSRPLHYLAILLLSVLILSGIGCRNGPFGKPQQKLPEVFQSSARPTLEQIQDAVNRNSVKIRSMQSDNAQVAVKGISSLSMRSTLSMDRPHRIRLKGGVSSITGGQEYDIGCNDDQFWIWFRRDPNRSYYTADIRQWATSPNRQLVPVDPSWIAEALGVVEFRADETHQGPFQTPDGHYEIRTTRTLPSGTLVKRTKIDSKTAVILEQEMFGSDGRPLVGARLSNHTFDTNSGIIFAKTVEIRSPNMEGPAVIQLGDVQFNTLDSSYSAGFFTKPTFAEFREVDLCQPLLSSPPRSPQYVPSGPPQSVPLYQGYHGYNGYQEYSGYHSDTVQTFIR